MIPLAGCIWAARHKLLQGGSNLEHTQGGRDANRLFRDNDAEALRRGV